MVIMSSRNPESVCCIHRYQVCIILFVSVECSVHWTYVGKHFFIYFLWDIIRISAQISYTPLFWQRPHKATAEEMTKFHSDDYIKFLRSIRPDNMSEYNKQMQRCKYTAYFTRHAYMKCWFILRVLYNEFMVVYKFPVARQVKELLMFTIIYKFAILLPKRNEKFPNLVVVYRFIYHMVEPLFCSLFYLCIINNTFLISNNSCSLDDCVNSWMNACTSFRIVQLWSHVCIFFPTPLLLLEIIG